MYTNYSGFYQPQQQMGVKPQMNNNPFIQSPNYYNPAQSQEQFKTPIQATDFRVPPMQQQIPKPVTQAPNPNFVPPQFYSPPAGSFDRMPFMSTSIPEISQISGGSYDNSGYLGGMVGGNPLPNLPQQPQLGIPESGWGYNPSMDQIQQMRWQQMMRMGIPY